MNNVQEPNATFYLTVPKTYYNTNTKNSSKSSNWNEICLSNYQNSCYNILKKALFSFIFPSPHLTGGSWSAQRAAVTTCWATESGTASLPTCPFLRINSQHGWGQRAGRKRANQFTRSLTVASRTLTMMMTCKDGRGIQKTVIPSGGGHRSLKSSTFLTLAVGCTDIWVEQTQTSKCVILSNVCTLKYFNNNANCMSTSYMLTQLIRCDHIELTWTVVTWW